MIINKKELITCVLITKGEFDLLKNSIFCYLKQNYLNKNLLILSQSEDNSLILDFLKNLNEEIIFVPCSGKLSYADLKNISVNISLGEIICEWDENDFYSSERILIQYNSLRSYSKNSCSAFTSFLRFSGEDKFNYIDLKSNENTRKFLPNSLMFYKKYYDLFDQFYINNDSILESGYNVMTKLSTFGCIGEVFNGDHYISGLKKEEILQSDVIEEILYEIDVSENKNFKDTNLSYLKENYEISK